jgi:hypothetical protein
MSRTPLEKLKSLTRQEQTAFIALFAGARMPIQLMYREADMKLHHDPKFGKAECEWVPFFEFWRDKLPALGLATYEEGAPFPLPGAIAGHVGTRVNIIPTDEGIEAREAYWNERRS